MPYNPDTWLQLVDGMRTACLAYLAAIRQPGDSAESLIPQASAWIPQQSDSERTLTVESATLQYAGSTPDRDVFLFVVVATWTDGTVSRASVQAFRSDIEG